MNESGHKYTFPVSGVPWAKYDARGRRLPDDVDVYLRGTDRQVLLWRFVGYILMAVMLVLLSRG